ncbi:MAG: DUF3487 family protein [Cocleimonas sp.]
MDNTQDFIPQYLDKEPAAFMGLSLNQLFTIVGKSFSISVPFTTMGLVSLTGQGVFFVLGLVLSAAISVGYTKYKAEKIRMESKGRPLMYSEHLLKIKFELFKCKHSFFRGNQRFFTVEDGMWGR